MGRESYLKYLLAKDSREYKEINGPLFTNEPNNLKSIGNLNRKDANHCFIKKSGTTFCDSMVVNLVTCKLCDKLYKTQNEHIKIIHGIPIDSVLNSHMPKNYSVVIKNGQYSRDESKNPKELQSKATLKTKSPSASTTKISQLVRVQSADNDVPSNKYDFDVTASNDCSSDCESDFYKSSNTKDKNKKHENRHIVQCDSCKQPSKQISSDIDVTSVKIMQISEINHRLNLDVRHTRPCAVIDGSSSHVSDFDISNNTKTKQNKGVNINDAIPCTCRSIELSQKQISNRYVDTSIENRQTSDISLESSLGLKGKIIHQTKCADNDSSSGFTFNFDVSNTKKENDKNCVNGNAAQQEIHKSMNPSQIQISAFTSVKQKQTCDKRLSSVSGSGDHQVRTLNKTRGKPFTCTICSKIWRYSSELKRHVKTHSQERNFTCNHCEKSYKTKKSLADHMKIISERHVCDECGKELGNKYSLASHKKAAHCKKRLKCGDCGRLCDSKTALSRHVTAVHLTKSVVTSCDVCSKVYSRKGLMQNHYARLHSGKEFICNDCSDVFKYKTKLVQHMQNKHLPPTFKCSNCSDMFTSCRNLQNHLRKAHAIDKRNYFLCPVCGKRFSQTSKLINHQRIHSGETPHMCEVCGKSFRTESNLFQHARTHSDVRPFKCELCDKAFRIKHHLKQHMAMHGMASVPKYERRAKNKGILLQENN